MICPNEIESGVAVAPNNIDLIVNLKYISRFHHLKYLMNGQKIKI